MLFSLVRDLKTLNTLKIEVIIIPNISTLDCLKNLILTKYFPPLEYFYHLSSHFAE